VWSVKERCDVVVETLCHCAREAVDVINDAAAAAAGGGGGGASWLMSSSGAAAS